MIREEFILLITIAMAFAVTETAVASPKDIIIAVGWVVAPVFAIIGTVLINPLLAKFFFKSAQKTKKRFLF